MFFPCFPAPNLRSSIFYLLRTDPRSGLGAIIHLADFQIRVFLPANAMPPPIEIMRKRPRPHLAQAIEFGDVFNANYNIPIRHFLT
jgi:hypothetical protein